MAFITRKKSWNQLRETPVNCNNRSCVRSSSAEQITGKKGLILVSGGQGVIWRQNLISAKQSAHNTHMDGLQTGTLLNEANDREMPL